MSWTDVQPQDNVRQIADRKGHATNWNFAAINKRQDANC